MDIKEIWLPGQFPIPNLNIFRWPSIRDTCRDSQLFYQSESEVQMSCTFWWHWAARINLHFLPFLWSSCLPLDGNGGPKPQFLLPWQLWVLLGSLGMAPFRKVTGLCWAGSRPTPSPQVGTCVLQLKPALGGDRWLCISWSSNCRNKWRWEVKHFTWCYLSRGSPWSWEEP